MSLAEDYVIDIAHYKARIRELEHELAELAKHADYLNSRLVALDDAHTERLARRDGVSGSEKAGTKNGRFSSQSSEAKQ